MRAPQVAIVAFFGWAAPQAARAADPSAQETQAEQDFLRRDMQRLADRGVWQGVERRYRELCAMEARGVVLLAESHLVAAEAARNLGDINGLVERLLRARDAGADVNEAVTDVLSRFGQVKLLVETRTAPTELGVEAEPFALEARQAIAAARQALADDRRYEGYLPLGSYSLAGTRFQVHANEGALAIVAAPQPGQRRTRRQPRSTPAQRSRRRPGRSRQPRRAGPAGAAGRGRRRSRGGRSRPLPHSSGGLPAPGQPGARLPFGEGWALRLEAGWTALLASGSQIQLGLAQAGISKDAAGFSWMAGAFYAGGVGSSQGLDPAAWQAGCAAGGCKGQIALTAEAAQQGALQGRVFGPGAEIGVERPLPNPGSLRPALGLVLGAWTDGAQPTGWLGLHLSLLTGGGPG